MREELLLDFLLSGVETRLRACALMYDGSCCLSGNEVNCRGSECGGKSEVRRGECVRVTVRRGFAEGVS